MEIGKQIRLCGWAGVLAAVIGFVAEMLLYGGFYGGAEYYRVSRQIMSEIPLSRLIWGGALGPIEAIFYLIGFWHIYLALKPGSQRLAQIVFAAFSAMMIVGGAFHSAFVYTGLITRALNTVQAVDLPVLKTLLSQSDTYIRLLYRVTFAFGLTGTLAFVWAVRRGARNVGVTPSQLLRMNSEDMYLARLAKIEREGKMEELMEVERDLYRRARKTQSSEGRARPAAELAED